MLYSEVADGHHLVPSVGTHFRVAIIETYRSKDKGLPKSSSTLEAEPTTEQPTPGTSLPEDEHPLMIMMSF